MILANVIFSTRRQSATYELEDVAKSYLGALFHSGQLCGEYFLTWTRGRLNAHVLLAGRAAARRRYHSPRRRSSGRLPAPSAANRSGGFSTTMPGGVHPRGEAPRFFTSSRMPSTGPRRYAAAMGSRRRLCACSRWLSSKRSCCISGSHSLTSSATGAGWFRTWGTRPTVAGTRESESSTRRGRRTRRPSKRKSTVQVRRKAEHHQRQSCSVGAAWKGRETWYDPGGANLGTPYEAPNGA